MSCPFDSIPEGKKAVLQDGRWSLVPLDKKVQTDAVILLGEAGVKISKLEEVISEQAAEIERLKIKLLEIPPVIPADGEKHAKKK
jgi:hypothetical protein